MTIAADPLPADSPHKRRASRLARQARVGILRNPNEPPRPPARKASLTGRWLSLRSSRRPPAKPAADALSQPPDAPGHAAPPPQAALRHDETGRLAGIDVAGLMASVDGLGTSRPIRTSYGSDMRPDLPPVAPPPPRPPAETTVAESPAREGARTPFAPAVTVAPPAGGSLAQKPRRRRSLLVPLLGGITLALVALVVIPAMVSL